MLIRTNFPKLLGFDALTLWPFIFITPALANDRALIEHELVHYRERLACCVIPWWIMYLASREFRFNAEVRGHAAQVKHGGCTKGWAAAHIVNNYRTGRSFTQAVEALGKALK